MKSIFSDLDRLIEQAVAKATQTEKSLQKDQEKQVKKRGLNSDDEKKKDEVDEAEEEESDDESAKKIKGKSSDDSSDKKSDDKTPGTKTSKKLSDPSQKVVKSPQFDDVKNKINALRGSGSLSKEETAKAVKEYLSSLSPAEKSALLTYLTNLAQIMAPVKSPDEVKNPQDRGIKTTYSGKKSKSEKSPESSKKDDVIVVGGK